MMIIYTEIIKILFLDTQYLSKLIIISIILVFGNWIPFIDFKFLTHVLIPTIK